MADLRASMKKGVKLSDSWMVCILLLLFQMAMSFGTGIFYSSAFFVLVPAYNLSVTWVSASGYIFVLVSIYTMVGVGYYGDLIVSRFGKRKPLVLAGYIFLCLASCLLAPLSTVNLFNSKSGNPDTDDGNGDGYGVDSLHNLLVPTAASKVRFEIWYLLCQVIAGFGSALFTIPFNSWFFESSLDTQDYSKLQLYCINLGSNAGYLLAILTLYNFQRTCLALGAVVLTCLGLPLLLFLMFYVHNEVVHDVHAAPARAGNAEEASSKSAEASMVSANTAGTLRDQGVVLRPLMLPSLRELFRDNMEFRKLLWNSVILNTGAGVVGEFVSYAPYILFPAIKHYKTLLTLATNFFFASLVLIVLLTAVAKRLWLGHCEMDKLVLYRRLILCFIGGCAVAFFMNFPRIWQEAEPGINIGTDDAVSDNETSGTALLQIYFYLAVQVFLAAMAGLAVYLNLMLTRDLIRFDEYRTGLTRYNMYQSALNIPPKILIGFLISMPQSIFYSSGYSTVDYDYSSGTGGDTYVTDDKINHKWTWTVWSYYELVFFQTVLGGLLAWAAYRLLSNYSLTQPVVDRVDEVLTERTRLAKQNMCTSSCDNDAMESHMLEASELDSPLMPSSSAAAAPAEGSSLPILSFAGDTRVLRLRAHMTAEEENQLVLHFSDYELQLMASPDAWKSVRIPAQERDSRGFRDVSAEECVAPLLDSNSDVRHGNAGNSGSFYLHHRNVGLETITFYHRLLLYAVSPAVLLLLLYANYVHIWRRNNSPFIPLTVNMFCMTTAYVFYEVLRAPVISELNRKMRGRVNRSPARSTAETPHISSSKRGSSGAAPKEEEEGEGEEEGGWLPNTSGKELLQGVLLRAAERLSYRVEELQEMLRSKPSSDSSSSAIDVDGDTVNLDVISVDYDPSSVCNKRVKRGNTHAQTRTQEYVSAQGVTHCYSARRYGGAAELATPPPQSAREPEKAFLVHSPESPSLVVWTRGGVASRACGGYVWVLVAFGALVAFGCVFISVI